MSDEPLQEDYDDWLRYPVTQWVLERMHEQVKAEINKVASGSAIYNPKNPQQTTALLGETLGYIRGLRYIKTLKTQRQDS